MKKLSPFGWFKDVSIARKLYFTVGIMAVLIGLELFTLFFSISTLSSVRAYVGGEGLWSKAQKDALYQLQTYGVTRNEENYQEFKEYMKVPLGDAKARAEMGKPDMDWDIARKGFIEGRNHPDDVDGMINLFRRFNNVSYIHNAIVAWSKAEPYALQLGVIGEKLHQEISSANPSQKKIDEILATIPPIIKPLTALEDEFSFTLGAGSRWLEGVILRLLFIIALTVEITGLLLAISVSRSIQKSIAEIMQAARSFAWGNLNTRAKVLSQDEIGSLAESFNQMAGRFEQSINELEQAQKKFKGLLESAPDAMVILDKDGIIKLVNSQTEILFGYNRDILIGSHVSVLIPPLLKKDVHPGNPAFLDTLKSRVTSEGLEVTGRKRHGLEFPVEISLSPMETDEGLLISLAVRDITERKNTEDRIRKSNQQLEIKNEELAQFAYVASHDLQEPLRSVASFVDLMNQEYGAGYSDNEKRYMNYIVESVQRMKNQIVALLDYSRIGRNNMLEKTDSGKLLHDAVANLDAAIKESGAVIKTSAMPTVQVYAEDLKMLFQNLIGNAIKFHKPNVAPVVKVDALQENGHVKFSVADNGIGIDKKYFDKIFVIFQRLHKRSEYPGTGIGLAHCRKIVELHGGKLWVESTPGQGSTFYFTIPNKN